MAVTDRSFHYCDHLGQRVYFCGARCKARFIGKPQRSGLHPGWTLLLAILVVAIIGGLWLA
jgi:hypothetical protein